jgi:hypothetical protein
MADSRLFRAPVPASAVGYFSGSRRFLWCVSVSIVRYDVAAVGNIPADARGGVASTQQGRCGGQQEQCQDDREILAHGIVP